MLKLRNIAIAALALGACATTPKTAAGRDQLEARADSTIETMKARDASLQDLLGSSAGYVVFPDIGKGGFIVGGAFGRGVLYEHGMRMGFVQLDQASVGALAGGQSFAELIVFRDRYDIDRLKHGHYSVGANASAVALTSGAAASVPLDRGVVVITMPRGGLMAELSVSGQRLDYKAKGT
jgi:lipid-binding SYLF domain-containing protein